MIRKILAATAAVMISAGISATVASPASAAPRGPYVINDAQGNTWKCWEDAGKWTCIKIKSAPTTIWV